jgi:hypothetical protein
MDKPPITPTSLSADDVEGSSPVRTLASMAIVAGLSCGQAMAEDAPTKAERADVQHVITAQIEAFRHDDGLAALGYAAPGIKAKYADGSAFLAMVRTAYPPVFRPRSFSFGEVMLHGGLLMQKVDIVGPDGVAASALYEMEHEADGTWRVAGCLLARPEQIQL